MFGNRLINTNAGGGGCTDTVDLYNPFPDGGGVALYQLNGNATDVSGNYDGTATNVTYGAGEFGQAGVFNGSSSLISAPNNSLLTQTQFSVSAWVNHNSATGYRTIISNYGYTVANGESGWIIALNAGKVRVFNIVSGASYFVDSIASIPGGVFTNIAVTNTQSQVNIYINGSLDSTHSMSGFVFNLAINNYLTIGAYKYDAAGSPNGKFNGSIDQVRIFSRALRPYEVEALYTEEYCTPTIVPSEHFNTVLYTGNGSTQSITGVGFQPDLVWVKNRQSPPIDSFNLLFDSVRGATKWLSSNATNAEGTIASSLTSFDSDGFSLGTDPVGGNEGWNIPGNAHVSWNFKAGGAAVTNTDGTITSQVSANTEAGFSVVSYTGNSTAGATIGHGLNNSPSVIITKGLNATSAYNWMVYHSALTQGTYGYLNLTNAFEGPNQQIWYNAPTSNLFSIGSNINLNSNGPYIAYCFAEVEGFSNFGSYVGTDAPNNNILTGFEPAMVIIKSTGATNGDWNIFDNKRNPTNPLTDVLKANTSGAETTEAALNISFLENGFSLNGATAAGGRGQINESGVKYIYMAFAADPTTIEPSLEDSFNTVAYSGTSGTQSITGVGFQPDLVWAKNRTAGTTVHILSDSVRGIKQLTSSGTDAEGSSTNMITSYDSDGFGVGDAFALCNASGYNFVAWCWKGAELPAINSNGSIPSVVSANPAAGFSIVSYTGAVTGANKTIGHGLNTAPAMVIVKDRDWGVPNWFIWHQGLSGGDYYLTFTPAAQTQNSAVFSAAPTSSVVNLGIDSGVGNRADRYIAYCFAEVAGFSKFGSYTGVIASGNPINVGFEPAFILVKRYNATENWVIFDNKRGSNFLMADRSDADINATTNAPVFTSTGFYFGGVSTGWNSAGNSYIYMAFANQF